MTLQSNPIEQKPSTDAWSIYGEMAKMGLDPIIQGGRYSFQRDAERRIIADILPKLKLEPHHRLLDIGCGAGALLVPLSHFVRETVGVDHPDVLNWLNERHTLEHTKLVAGCFPDVILDGLFDRIICYAVMQAMQDFTQMTAFALAGAALLKPGGRFLLGDMPSRGRQIRFRATDAGQAFEKEWEATKANNPPTSAAEIEADGKMLAAKQIGGISDEQICSLLLELRKAGFDAYVVEQNPDLPFGRTREDILIVRG